jgi:hypothetical protein
MILRIPSIPSLNSALRNSGIWRGRASMAVFTDADDSTCARTFAG